MRAGTASEPRIAETQPLRCPYLRVPNLERDFSARGDVACTSHESAVMFRPLLLLPLLLSTVLGLIVAVPLSSAISAAAAHPPLDLDRRCPPVVRVVHGEHGEDHAEGQLRIVCRGQGGEVVDIGLPAGWIRFLTRHVDDGRMIIGGESIDLLALWSQIEELDRGEEVLIEEGGDQVRIWIE